MERVGYSIIVTKIKTEVVAFGPLALGESIGIPEVVTWPNGDQTHGILVGHKHKEWTFVERWLEDEPRQWCSFIDHTIKYNRNLKGVLVTANYSKTPNIVPSTISAFKLRQAVNKYAGRDQIEKFIQDEPIEIRDAWEYKHEHSRHDKLINDILYHELGLSQEEIDEIFRS